MRFELTYHTPLFERGDFTKICPQGPIGTSGRTWTGKPKRKILSLLSLPISPHSHVGALGETRTLRTWFLRPVRIPNSVTRAKLSWWMRVESNYHFTPYEGGALPLCYSSLGCLMGFEPTHIGITIRGLNHLTTSTIWKHTADIRLTLWHIGFTAVFPGHS